MRVGVVGAGAIGGALAAVLDRAGHHVQVTARDERLDEISRHGLRLSGAWGEHIARVEARAVLDTPVDLAIAATKAPDLEQALRDNREGIGARLLVVRNGLGARQQARQALGGADGVEIIGGLAVFAASLVSATDVVITAGAPLYIGGSPVAGDLAASLQPALPTVLLRDFEGAEWTKLIVNQVNALPAITGLSVQETVADDVLRRVLTRSVRETLRVGRAQGVHFAPMQGLNDLLLRAVALAPVGAAELLPRAMARRMGSVPNPGSTLQSIRRGRPTEIDYLNGAVVEAATRLGLDAPINAALVAMVHEVERTGRFFSPTEVASRT